MCKRIICVLSIASLALVSSLAFSQGKNYKVAIKDLASAPFYTSLIKAIMEQTGNTADIQVVPMARSEYMISTNAVDIAMPHLKLPSKGEIKFDTTSIVLYEASFVLYANKERPIAAARLANSNPDNLVVEMDPTLVDILGFKGEPSTDFGSSLKKLSLRRIDGCIISLTTGDPVLKTFALKNITRKFYKSFPVTIMLQKGTAGGEVEKMLSAGISALKANGKYDEIMGALIRANKYEDWQP
jgi:hypothetical protein